MKSETADCCVISCEKTTEKSFRLYLLPFLDDEIQLPVCDYHDEELQRNWKSYADRQGSI